MFDYYFIKKTKLSVPIYLPFVNVLLSFIYFYLLNYLFCNKISTFATLSP